MLYYDQVEPLNLLQTAVKPGYFFHNFFFSEVEEVICIANQIKASHTLNLQAPFYGSRPKAKRIKDALCVRINSLFPFSFSLFSFDTRPGCTNRPIWMRSNWPNCTLRYETHSPWSWNSEGIQSYKCTGTLWLNLTVYSMHVSANAYMSVCQWTCIYACIYVYFLFLNVPYCTML